LEYSFSRRCPLSDSWRRRAVTRLTWDILIELLFTGVLRERLVVKTSKKYWILSINKRYIGK